MKVSYSRKGRNSLDMFVVRGRSLSGADEVAGKMNLRTIKGDRIKGNQTAKGHWEIYFEPEDS